MNNFKVAKLMLALSLVSTPCLAATGVSDAQIAELRQSADYTLDESGIKAIEGILNSTNPFMKAYRSGACMNLGSALAYLHVKVTLDPSSDSEVAPIRERIGKLATVCTTASK